MAKINVYNLGDLGVDIVKSPLHIPDGAWRRLQNGEFATDQGQHGIKKRGSLAKINSSALAGSISGVANVPLAYPGTKQMLVAMNSAEDPTTWKSTEDGASYTNIASSALGLVTGAAQIGGVVNASNFFFSQRGGTWKNAYYFPGGDFISYPTSDFTAPPLIQWDGATAFTVFRIPTNPTSTAGSTPRLITDVFTWNGLIYISVWDHGSSSPNEKGRVLAFNPANGTLSIVGNRFGADTGENARGTPYALASYLGQLWVGTNAWTGTSGNMGSIWRMTPGAETVWTSDKALTGVQVGVMSLLAYKSKLYATMAVGVGGTALVIVRDPVAQTWATSFTAPSSGVSYTGALIEFDGNLYTSYFKTTADLLIKKFDNSSWATDKDVGADINSTHAPGNPFVFNDALYWPFFDASSDASQTGYLLKRTTGGTWSTVLSSLGLRGALGYIIPGL